MRWNRYTIKTNTKDCDMICAVLTDFDINDVQIENNVQLTDEELNKMYADFVKELPEDDGSCCISFYLDENGYIPEGTGTGDSPTAANESPDFKGVFVDVDALKAGLEEACDIFGLDRIVVEASQVDTNDWNEKWKEFFKPLKVGEIVIKPSWEEVPKDLIPENADGIIIDIDPGMAFGTGIHETTRLCLDAIQKYIKKDDVVLDLGTGSGILGIAALKKGAAYVAAVDIDEQAVKIAEDNFIKNGLNERAAFFAGNILQRSDAGELTGDLKEGIGDRKFDIIVANILADVIIPVSEDIHKFLKIGGLFIASGIIDSKETEVTEAIEANCKLKLIEVNKEADWRCFIARRIE